MWRWMTPSSRNLLHNSAPGASREYDKSWPGNGFAGLFESCLQFDCLYDSFDGFAGLA
jgi:hypothetical protein